MFGDENVLNERLRQLENTIANKVPNTSTYLTKEQQENEQLKKENEILKQRLQMANDPVRVEFEQSDEFQKAFMSNIVSYLYEVNMAGWAQSPYAQRFDAWTKKRLEELKAAKQQPRPQPQPQTQTNFQPQYPTQTNSQGG